MVIKLQNYKNINTRAMQCSVIEMHHLIKRSSFWYSKYGLSMFFSTGQKKHFIFLPPSLPTVCLLRFLSVKKNMKKSTLALIASLPTL